MSFRAENLVRRFWSTAWCASFLGLWATRPLPSPTRSRTGWCRHLSTPVRETTKAGRFPRCFCRATTSSSTIGGWSKPSSAPRRGGLRCTKFSKKAENLLLVLKLFVFLHPLFGEKYTKIYKNEQKRINPIR